MHGHSEKVVLKEEWSLVRGPLACTNAWTLSEKVVLKDGLFIYPAFCYTSVKCNESSPKNPQRPFKHRHWRIVPLRTPWNDDRDLNVTRNDDRDLKATKQPCNVMNHSEHQPWLYQQTCPHQVGFPESAGTLSLLTSSPIASALHSESAWLWLQRENYSIKTVLWDEKEKSSNHLY